MLDEEEEDKVYFRRQTDETQRIIGIAVQEWMDKKWAELGKCGASWFVKLIGAIAIWFFGVVTHAWFTVHAPNLRSLVGNPGG